MLCFYIITTIYAGREVRRLFLYRDGYEIDGSDTDFNIILPVKIQYSDFIEVLLNGSTAKVHEQSRDVFFYALEAFTTLKKTSLSYGINWVARMDNIDDLPNLIRLAKCSCANNINILRY